MEDSSISAPVSRITSLTTGSFRKASTSALLASSRSCRIDSATVTKLLSWTFIRLEINFTNAVAVGAFAGAGGIGFQLYQAGSRYYNLHEVGVIVYVCLVAAFALEFVSVRLRRRYLVND